MPNENNLTSEERFARKISQPYRRLVSSSITIAVIVIIAGVVFYLW
jgi:hypothetical protein